MIAVSSVPRIIVPWGIQASVRGFCEATETSTPCPPIAFKNARSLSVALPSVAALGCAPDPTPDPNGPALVLSADAWAAPTVLFDWSKTMADERTRSISFASRASSMQRGLSGFLPRVQSTSAGGATGAAAGTTGAGGGGGGGGGASGTSTVGSGGGAGVLKPSLRGTCAGRNSSRGDVSTAGSLSPPARRKYRTTPTPTIAATTAIGRIMPMPDRLTCPPMAVSLSIEW